MGAFMKNKELTSKLAINLSRLRKSMGLTQKQVADAVGVKRSTYAYYERDTMPSVELIEKFAKVFNVTASYILFPEEQGSGDGSQPSGMGTLNHPPVDLNFTDDNIIRFASLTREEQNFLLKMRLLSDVDKAQLVEKLDELVEKSEN